MTERRRFLAGRRRTRLELQTTTIRESRTMNALWHHSRQQKTEGPVNSQELRRLVSLEQIEPTDLVRRSGSKCWVRAARVEGLFNANAQKWHYACDQGTLGPVTLKDLFRLARDGRLQPGDLIWTSGMSRWKRADRIVGLFPTGVPSPSVPPTLPAQTRARSGAPVVMRARRRPVTIPPGGDGRATGSREPARPASRIPPQAAFKAMATVLGFLVLTMTAGRLLAVWRTPPLSSVPGQRIVIPPTSPNTPEQSAPDPTPPLVQETPRSTPATPDPSHAVAKPPATPSNPLTWTAEDVARVGLAVHKLIVDRHVVEEDTATRNRLSQAAAPLLASSANRMPELTFTILKSDEVFMFSHPGNYLYVSRGLLNFVRNDIELQFQIARELAHLERNDLVRAAEALGEPGLDLAHRLYRQLALGYADYQVFEADHQAFRALQKPGRPTYKLLSVLSASYDFNGAVDPRGSRRKPASQPFDDRQQVENHWHSFPPASERLARLRVLETSNLRDS
jgi:hypothetical protein